MLEDMISVGVPKGTTIPPPRGHQSQQVHHGVHQVSRHTHLAQGSHHTHSPPQLHHPNQPHTQSPPQPVRPFLSQTHVVISMTGSTLRDSPSKMFKSRGITVTQNPHQTPKKESPSPSPIASPTKGIELGPIVPTHQQQQFRT